MDHSKLERLIPFEKLAAARRIVMYPAGTGAAFFHDYLTKRHPELLPRIIGLGDRDPNKQGQRQLDWQVYAPEDLAGLKPDMVLVTSLSFEPIVAALRPFLPADVAFVDGNVIKEYLAFEAESSALAARVAEQEPDGSNILRHDSWFTCMPVGRDKYTRSNKKAYTFRMLSMLDLPEDMTGQSVLDLGCSDGFYGFECLARGAKEAVGVESYAWDTEAGMQCYLDAREFYGLNARPVHADVETMDFGPLGTFDTVLCLGLYYHLKNPMGFFDKLAAVTGDTLLLSGRVATQPVLDAFAIESGVAANKTASYFVRTSSEPKWLANIACLRDMLTYSGFRKVEILEDLCPNGSQISSAVLRARK